MSLTNRELLKLALNLNSVVAVHRINSTLIKGVCAKPSINILIEVNSLEELDSENHLMESFECEVNGEFVITSRRFSKKVAYNEVMKFTRF
ncbi:GrpB family protein [Vibrio alginolyticus]|uniref:GrpB family protein n=1 Tax=Vibrio alginolyticus TaxID=663 RepID=UPI0007230601|nr:GrpB family protein [Vibrio alginolyticus]ALR95492.1 hypothetical protein AT730_24395 [Vibrio alginolyticus]